MTARAEVLVEVLGVTKSFPGVVALDGASLRLHAGEVVGLVGKNGAGKSTLIKVLAGAVRPDAGELILDGAPVQLSTPHDAAAAGFAFVHQELADVPNLSVAENVLLGKDYPHRGPFVDRRELQRRAAAELARLEVDISPGAPMRSLSPVQKRLVMIARALAQRARLLVLDEPSASLTEEEIRHLHAVVRALSASGVTVVYITHRLEEILTVTERVVVMRAGRVVAERETAEVEHRELVRMITGAETIEERAAARSVRTAGAGAALTLEGVTLGAKLRALSMSVRAGEIVGVAGLVGSGRTTLARIIAGDLRPAAGTIEVNGRRVVFRSPADAIRAGVVLLPEDRRRLGNILDFTLQANVTLASLREHRLARWLPVPSPRHERATALARIDQLEIRGAAAATPVRWLSGGNQQKVLVARWLGHPASVLVFDEPTQGIDVEAKDEVFALLDRLAAQGKGVVLISSDFSELVRICDRVLTLRDGRFASELAGEEIDEAAITAACYEDDPALV
ncbi:MAG: sugar transporter ATP-binding protein [Solirubrobacterales bacterium]|nr:sugar transporter ATP-binding protein [Solirubrobacterales bacterium]